MIRFVKNGCVAFTENDKGDLVFVDKTLERSFIEKAAEVKEDAEPAMELTPEQSITKLAETLAEAYRSTTSNELKARIKTAWEKVITKAEAERIDTTNLTLE